MKHSGLNGLNAQGEAQLWTSIKQSGQTWFIPSATVRQPSFSEGETAVSTQVS